MASSEEDRSIFPRNHLALVSVTLTQEDDHEGTSPHADTTTSPMINDSTNNNHNSTNDTVQDELLHIYEHYATLYPNHALVQEQREADELLRAIHATHSQQHNSSPALEQESSSTQQPPASTTTTASWTSRWFSWGKSVPDSSTAKQLQQQHYNRQSNQNSTAETDLTHHALLEYSPFENDDNDTLSLPFSFTERGLDVTAIPDEAHALARFQWASRQRHATMNPIMPASSNRSSTLLITGLGKFTEILHGPEDSVNDSSHHSWRIQHSSTPDQSILQQHADQQPTPWSFRHARGIWITDTIVAVAWGLHDGWIVLYQKEASSPQSSKTSWTILATCAPTPPVLEQLSQQGALMDDDDNNVPTSPLLLVTDLVLIPNANGSSVNASSWTLGVARLGGFVELVPLTPLQRKATTHQPIHLTNEGTMALTTAEYHTDVLSLAVMVENNKNDATALWNQELYPHTPPAKAILVASGTHMGTEHVSFWGVSITTEDPSSTAWSANILEAINLGYGGPECTLFATPTLWKYWRKARQVQLSQSALSKSTETISTDASTSNSTPPITTISVSKPLGRILVNNGGLVFLWDGNEGVTSMDCRRLIRLAYHCLDKQEYRGLLQSEQPAIPLVETLFDRSHFGTQLSQLAQDQSSDVTSRTLHVTALQMLPQELAETVPKLAFLTDSGQLVLCSAATLDFSPLSLSLDPASASMLRNSTLIVQNGMLSVLGHSTNDEYYCSVIHAMDASAILVNLESNNNFSQAWDMITQLSGSEQELAIDTVESIKVKVWEAEGDIKALESLTNDASVISVALRFCVGEPDPPVHLVNDLSNLRALLELGLQRISGARLATTTALGGPEMIHDAGASIRHTLLLLGTFEILKLWLIDPESSILSVNHFFTSFAPNFDVSVLANKLAEDADIMGLSLLVFRHWEILLPSCGWLLKIPPTVSSSDYSHLLPVIRQGRLCFICDTSTTKLADFESFPSFVQERYQVQVVIDPADKRLVLGPSLSEGQLQKLHQALQDAYLSRIKIIQGFAGSVEQALKFSELVQVLNEKNDETSPLRKSHQSLEGLLRMQGSGQASFGQHPTAMSHIAAATGEDSDPDTLMAMVLQSGESYRGMADRIESIIPLLSEGTKISLEKTLLDYGKKSLSSKSPFVMAKLPAINFCAALVYLSKVTRPTDSRVIKDDTLLFDFAHWIIQLCVEKCRIDDAARIMDPLWTIYESLSVPLSDDSEQDQRISLLYRILKAAELAIKWKDKHCHGYAIKLITADAKTTEELGYLISASIFSTCFLEGCTDSIALGDSHYGELVRGALSDGKDIANTFGLESGKFQELATLHLFVPILFANKTAFLASIDTEEFDGKLMTEALSHYIDDNVFSVDGISRMGLLAELQAQFSHLSPTISQKLEHAQMCVDACRSYNAFPLDGTKPPLRPFHVRDSSSSIEVLERLFSASRESVVFGCDEWADKASAVILNQSIRESVKRVNAGGSLEETDTYLPRLPGLEVFGLAQILGLVAHNEVVVVKCLSASHARQNGFHGACAALCRDLLLKDLLWNNERSSAMEEMVLHEVLHLVELPSFEDLATKVELCRAALSFSWLSHSLPSYKKVLHIFSSLEYGYFATGSHSSSIRTFHRDTLQHMSEDVYGLLHLISMKADGAGPSDESLASLSRFSTLWSSAHVTETPGWSARGKVCEVGDIGIWSLRHIQNEEAFSSIVSELEREAYEEIKRVEALSSPNAGSRANEEIVWQLQQRGYSRYAALRAAMHGMTFDQALQWAMMHSTDPDFDAPLIRLNESPRSSRDAEWLLKALGKLKSGKMRDAQGKFLPEAKIDAGLIAASKNYSLIRNQRRDASTRERSTQEAPIHPPESSGVKEVPVQETFLKPSSVQTSDESPVVEAPLVTKPAIKASDSSSVPKNVAPAHPVGNNSNTEENRLASFPQSVPQTVPVLAKAPTSRPLKVAVSSSLVTPLRKPRVSPKDMSSTDRSNFRQRGKDFLNKLKSDGMQGKSDRQRLLEQGRQLMKTTKIQNGSSSPASLSSLSTDSHTVPSMKLGVSVPSIGRTSVRAARIASNAMNKTASLSKEERQALVERARAVRHEGRKGLQIQSTKQSGGEESIVSPSMADKGRQLLANAQVARTKSSSAVQVRSSGPLRPSNTSTTNAAGQFGLHPPKSPPPSAPIAVDDDNWDFDDEDLGLEKSFSADREGTSNNGGSAEPSIRPPPPPQNDVEHTMTSNDAADDKEDDGWDFEDFDQDDTEFVDQKATSPQTPLEGPVAGNNTDEDKEDNGWDFDDFDQDDTQAVVEKPPSPPLPLRNAVEQAPLDNPVAANDSVEEEEDNGWDFDDIDQDDTEEVVPKMPTSQPPAPPPDSSSTLFLARESSQSSTIPPNSEPLESPSFPELRKVLPKEFDSRPPAPARPAMPPIPPPPPLPPPILETTTSTVTQQQQPIPALSLEPPEEDEGMDDDDGWDFDDPLTLKGDAWNTDTSHETVSRNYMSVPLPPPLLGGAMTTYPVRPLYGGAMTAQIPEGWLDVSDMRQVPSHQECWQDPTTGALLVVEILDYQTSVTNDVAAQYFYQDLAEANGVPESDRQFSVLPANKDLTLAGDSSSSSTICLGKGLQKIQQGKEYDASGNKRDLPEGHWVQIDLAVIRLPKFTTDMLVTLSSPTPTSPPQANTQSGETLHSSHLFQMILSSIHIQDWSLFG